MAEQDSPTVKLVCHNDETGMSAALKDLTKNKINERWPKRLRELLKN